MMSAEIVRLSIFSSSCQGGFREEQRCQRRSFNTLYCKSSVAGSNPASGGDAVHLSCLKNKVTCFHLNRSSEYIYIYTYIMSYNEFSLKFTKKKLDCIVFFTLKNSLSIRRPSLSFFWFYCKQEAKIRPAFTF